LSGALEHAASLPPLLPLLAQARIPSGRRPPRPRSGWRIKPPARPRPSRRRLPGLDGAAAAFVTCSATSAALLAAYTACRDWRRRGRPDATWGGLSRGALQGWGEYLALALPALAAIAAEWLAFECMIVASGGRLEPRAGAASVRAAARVLGPGDARPGRASVRQPLTHALDARSREIQEPLTGPGFSTGLEAKP
jgi:hypothetical protein